MKADRTVVSDPDHVAALIRAQDAAVDAACDRFGMREGHITNKVPRRYTASLCFTAWQETGATPMVLREITCIACLDRFAEVTRP